MKKILFISMLLLSIGNQNCSNPRAECERELSALNTQAIFSFGTACLFSTYMNDPNNLVRCQAVALLNYACGKKPGVAYNFSIDTDVDNTKKNAKYHKDGQQNTILALLLFNDAVDKSFIYDRGQNIIDLLEYLVMKHYEQNALDGETKTVLCAKSGSAKTTFIKNEFIVVLNECQQASDSVVSSSMLIWNGNLQGFLTYTRYISNNYYLDWVSMYGTLNYNGSITNKTFGGRIINENCPVSVDYKNYSGKFSFCYKTSY